MLQFADRAWSDEQKEFKCNTKEPGQCGQSAIITSPHNLPGGSS